MSKRLQIGEMQLLRRLSGARQATAGSLPPVRTVWLQISAWKKLLITPPIMTSQTATTLIAPNSNNKAGRVATTNALVMTSLWYNRKISCILLFNWWRHVPRMWIGIKRTLLTTTSNGHKRNNQTVLLLLALPNSDHSQFHEVISWS